MTIIKLSVNDQKLSVASEPKVASGVKNSVWLHLNFSTNWDGYVKSAVFYTSWDKAVYEVLLDEDKCIIPHEVLAKSGSLYIGIRGIDTETNAEKTSTLVKYKIDEGAPVGDATSVEPTPDVYHQILDKLAEIKEPEKIRVIVAEYLTENPPVPGKDGKDGYTPVKGKDYFTSDDVTQIAEVAADMVDVPPAVKIVTASANRSNGTWNNTFSINATFDEIKAHALAGGTVCLVDAGAVNGMNLYHLQDKMLDSSTSAVFVCYKVGKSQASTHMITVTADSATYSQDTYTTPFENLNAEHGYVLVADGIRGSANGNVPYSWKYVPMPEGSSVEVDTTLTHQGYAADAKAVGDALAEKQPKGNYLTEIPNSYVQESELSSIIYSALSQAKTSGEFDGKDGEDGYTPVKGVDYFDGEPGPKGEKGEDGYSPVKGVDYFTPEDVTKIAEEAAGLVEVPEGDGVTVDPSLTQQGSAADARAVGEAIAQKSQVRIIKWEADD